MVPDFAKVALNVCQQQTEVLQRFKDFKKLHTLEGNYYVENGELILELEGVSAHGMEPDNGKNAGLYLAQFIHENNADQAASSLF